VVLYVISCGEHVGDPLVDDLLLAVDALGIDPQQDIHPIAPLSARHRAALDRVERWHQIWR
jgi:hypothetical protein